MKNEKFKKELLSYFKIIVFSWILSLVIVNFVVRPVVVQGRSMYPTLHDNDWGISNIFGLKLNKVERFDIVVVRMESRSDYLVKRVIGLPGEEIRYADDKLYVDGVYVEEPFLNTDYVKGYINESKDLFTRDFTVTLGEDEYYCLGDNRPHSSDSRVFGPFRLSDFTSKSVFVFVKGKE